MAEVNTQPFFYLKRKDCFTDLFIEEFRSVVF